MTKKKITKKKITTPKNQTSPPVTPQQEITILKDDAILKKKSFLSLQFWKQKQAKINYKNALIINMELRNGNHRIFHIKTNSKGFDYDGGHYLLDEECKYYNIDLKDYMLDYHQDFALPIKRKMPINKLNQSFKKFENEIELTTNPSLLKIFVTSQIAEAIMKGAEIDEFFKKIYLFLIINTVMVAIILFIVVKSSGMLENMDLPF